MQPRADVRLCDYAIDSVKWWVEGDDEATLMSERWQEDSSANSEDAPLAPVSDIASNAPAATVCDNALESLVVHPVVPIPVLGFAAHEFAEAVSALTDSEEMVLALVHPLVQVYTIPRTGQLAYVGHVCNFRQKTAAFISSLPTVPENMPFVMVRPRNFKNHNKRGSPFKIDVDKVRKAFAWLKKFNP